jgi:hypothetical protein
MSCFHHTRQCFTSQALFCALAVFALVACERKEHPAPAVRRLTERPEFYSSAAFHARIVDDRTSEPIAGAVVVVLWRTVDAYRDTFGSVYLHDEMVTGPDGRIEFPRWGPRTLHYDYYLDARDPEIWVLKRGYLLGYFDNTGALDPKIFRSADALRRGRISKEPPRFVLQGPSATHARPAQGTSVWNDKHLSIHRASSAEEEARSLALTAPLDLYEPSRVDLPLFFQEWTEARDALPADLRQSIEPPPRPSIRNRPRTDAFDKSPMVP